MFSLKVVAQQRLTLEIAITKSITISSAEKIKFLKNQTLKAHDRVAWLK